MSRIDQLQKLLAAEPDDVFLNFALAIELAKGGRREEGVAQFDKVLALDPNYVAAYYHKANTLIALERAEAARTTLETGIAQARSIGEAHAASEMATLLDGLG